MPPRVVVVFAVTSSSRSVSRSLVQTARVGGGVGYLLGVLFVALGVGSALPATRSGR